MNSRCPLPRATIAGESACASSIGARRLTVSARSISSAENECSPPLPGQPGVGDEHVDLARPRPAARDGASGSARSDTIARPPTSSASGVEHVHPPAGQQSTRRRARAAPARSPGRGRPSRPSAAPAHRRGSCEHRHRGRKGMQEVAAADRADLARGEEPRRRGARQRVARRPRRRGRRGRTSRARGRCRRTAARPPAAGRPARSCGSRAPRAGRGRRSRRRGRAGARPGRGARRRRSRSGPVSGSAPTSPRTRKSPCR